MKSLRGGVRFFSILTAAFLVISAAEGNYPLQKITAQKSALVNVRGEVTIASNDWIIGGHVFLKHGNKPLNGWKVTLNTINVPSGASGKYYIPNVTQTVHDGMPLTLTMVPPRPLPPLNKPGPVYKIITAAGTFEKVVQVTHPGENDVINLETLPGKFLMARWNYPRGSYFSLFRVSLDGRILENIYYRRWVAKGGAFLIPKSKIKNGNRYKIAVLCFFKNATFSGPVTQKSVIKITMYHESFFITALENSFIRKN